MARAVPERVAREPDDIRVGVEVPCRQRRVSTEIPQVELLAGRRERVLVIRLDIRFVVVVVDEERGDRDGDRCHRHAVAGRRIGIRCRRDGRRIGRGVCGAGRDVHPDTEVVTRAGGKGDRAERRGARLVEDGGRIGARRGERVRVAVGADVLDVDRVGDRATGGRAVGLRRGVSSTPYGVRSGSRGRCPSC